MNCPNAYSPSRGKWNRCELKRFHDGPCAYEDDGVSQRERVMWEKVFWAGWLARGLFSRPADDASDGGAQ